MNWFKQAKKEEYKGWTAVKLNTSLSKKIQQWGRDNVPSSELSADGRETDHHITLLYGIHTKNREVVKKLLTIEKPVKAILGKIGCFTKNNGFDVVIIKINSPDLHRLHKKIKEELNVKLTHDVYVPHCTIAYVKKGEAMKYAGKTIFQGEKITFNKIIFKDGVSEEETIIPLKK